MIKICKTDMQKLIVLTAALILILFFVAGDVYASEGIKLIASEEEGEKGDQVVVKINAENAAGTDGGQFLLNFDPSLVKPVSANSGQFIEEAESNLFMINREFAEGQLKVMWVTALADTADSGVVCEVTFDLLNEGSTALELEDIVISPDQIETAKAFSGEITIEDTGVDTEKNEIESETTELEEAVMENDNDEEVTAVETNNNNTALIIVALVLIAAAGGYAAFKKFGKTATAKH